MVTRETTLQLVFVVLAILTAMTMNALFPAVMGEPGGFTLGIVAFYGVGLGGAHLYLYLTGGGEGIPRSAHARLLAALSVAFGLLAGGSLLEGEHIATLDVPIILALLAALVFVGYFVNEMRHGYADFAEEAGLR